MVQVMKTEIDNHRSFRGINIRNSKAKTNEWVIIHFHLDVKKFIYTLVRYRIKG